MSERASIFGDDTDLDLDVTGFAPKKVTEKQKSIPREAVRAVSEAANFPSREPTAVFIPATPTAPIRQSRRHRTGRNIQINMKVRQETLDRLYKITDTHGWVLGETLENALTALEEKMSSK